MRYTVAGRSIYAVGGNAEAARLSGISSERTIMMVFIIHGSLSLVLRVSFSRLSSRSFSQPFPPISS